MSTEYNLINQLEEYGLDFLVPEFIDLDDGESPTGFRDSEVYEEEVYYFDEIDDEEDMELTPEEWEQRGYISDLKASISPNLEYMKELFECEYMSDEDFLQANIWQLFHITKRQFEMIDLRYLDEYNFSDFYSAFVQKEDVSSIEKRILYSTVEAITHYGSTWMYNNLDYGCTETKDYIERRIIDCHTIEESEYLISLLKDYLRFYSDALIMNDRRAQEEGPVFKYVKFPKPAHLKDLHDKAFRDYQAMSTERRAEERDRLNEQIGEVAASSEYRHLLYKNDKFAIVPAISQDDLDEEGKKLQHCVASYGNAMAERRSFIYKIRKTSNLDEPYFTVEIIPDYGRTMKYELTQCYTYKDSTEKPAELKEFILNWVRNKKIKKSCTI